MAAESSFLIKPQNLVIRQLFDAYQWFAALTNPIWWILDRDSKTVLDVGCGQGYPMQEIKKFRQIEATGVDLFEESLKEAKSLGIYHKVVKADILKMPFKEKSFDTVICLQVIEHLTKEQGYKLLKELERIASKQVIISTPLGFFEHPETDHNKLQKHLSGWYDKDFEKLGYQVKHQSLDFFLGNEGLVHRPIPRPFKALVFMLDHLLMPVYFLFPKLADYWIIAYKKIV